MNCIHAAEPVGITEVARKLDYMLRNVNNDEARPFSTEGGHCHRVVGRGQASLPAFPGERAPDLSVGDS